MIPFLLSSVAIAATPAASCQEQARAQGFVVLQTQSTAEGVTLKTWRRGQIQTLTCPANGTVTLNNPENPSELSLANSRWQLHDEATITLEFRDGRIGGSGGCNRYGGRYTLSPTAFTVQGVVSTRRACAPAIMERENRFFAALNQAQRLRRQGPDLILETGSSSEPLRFHPQKP